MNATDITKVSGSVVELLLDACQAEMKAAVAVAKLAEVIANYGRVGMQHLQAESKADDAKETAHAAWRSWEVAVSKTLA